MNDKMREAMIAAAKIVANPHGYTETSVIVADALLGIVSQSVPVVGEPTKELAALAYQRAFEEGEAGGDFNLRIARQIALLLKQTHSITAAELERLRKDAERAREDSRLEFALEQLVNVCNNHNDACNWSETISAEAALEKLYKRRPAAAIEAEEEKE